VTVWSRTAGRDPPPEGAPFALVERTARGLALSALNGPARALGLAMGQSHADACAAVPHLSSAPAEPDADRKALRRLALWAERFSPLVAIDETFPGQEGLILDMTGGAHLFGGEPALLADLQGRLARARIPARCAMADTAGAAWALARFSGDPQAIAAQGQTRDALCALPVAALRLEPQAVGLLARLGLKRIGELYALPRAGLARRFQGEMGLAVVERLDQALGVTPEPLIPHRPAPRYRIAQMFAEPMMDALGAAHWLPALADGLVRRLEQDGKGARRVRLTAFRVDGRTTSIDARLSAPSVNPAHIIRLLKERGLERLDLGFGADALMLSAPVAEALTARQGEMEGADQAAADALAGLVDRLEARLGEGAVLVPRLHQSWLPERAARWEKPGGVLRITPQRDAMRPLLMFDPPEFVEAIAELPDAAPARFTWRRVSHRVVKAAGPERLSPEWWRGAQARTRDYYRVEDEAGRGYWLFREGLYGRESADKAPTWRLHGVFA